MLNAIGFSSSLTNKRIIKNGLSHGHMKKYSYNLFPKPFVVLGYLLILYAFALVLMNLTLMKSENHFNDFATSFAIKFIGLIIILFKSFLIRKSNAFGHPWPDQIDHPNPDLNPCYFVLDVR